MEFDANYRASASTVRSSHSYTSTKTLPGKSSYTVYLLDGQPVQIQIERKSSGRDLFDECCLSLSPPIEEKDYFSLSFDVMEHGKEVRTWIDFTKPVAKQRINARHKALAMNVKFYPPDPTQLLEFTRYLFYLQLRDDLSKGKMPCAFKTLALLGSYVCQADVGNYTADMDFDILYSFPFGPDENTPELVNNIIELWQSHAGLSTAESEMNYIENAKKLPLYGTHLHPATDSDNIDIDIGINYSGVLVFRNKVRINRIAWPMILKISYKRDYFYVRVRPAENDRYEKTIGFKMEGYKAAKRVWKICIEHHAFFRLVRPDPRSKKLKFGSKPNLTFQTEYQVKKNATLKSDYQTFDQYETLGSNQSNSLTRCQPPNNKDGYLTRIGLFIEYKNQQEAPNVEQLEEQNQYLSDYDQRFPEEQPGMRYPDEDRERRLPERKLESNLSASKFDPRYSQDLHQNSGARYDIDVSQPNFHDRELDAGRKFDSRIPERQEQNDYSPRLPENRQEFEFDPERRFENDNGKLKVNGDFDPRSPKGIKDYQGQNRPIEGRFSTDVNPNFDATQGAPEFAPQKSVETKAARMSLGFWNRGRKGHDEQKISSSPPEVPQDVEVENGNFDVGVTAEVDFHAKQRKPLLPFMKKRDKSRDKSKPEKEEKEKKSMKKGKPDQNYDFDVSPEVPPRSNVDVDPSFDVEENLNKAPFEQKLNRAPFEENFNKAPFKSSFERLQEMGAVQASFPKMDIRGDVERPLRSPLQFEKPQFMDDRRQTDSPNEMEYNLAARPGDRDLPRGFRSSVQGPDPPHQPNRDLVQEQLRDRYEKQSSLENEPPEFSRNPDRPVVPAKPLGVYSRNELTPRNFPDPGNDGEFSGRVALNDDRFNDPSKREDAELNFEPLSKVTDRPSPAIKANISQFSPKNDEIPQRSSQFDRLVTESNFSVPPRPAYNEARRNFFASKPQKDDRQPEVTVPVSELNDRIEPRNLTPQSVKKQPPALAPKPKRLLADRSWMNEPTPNSADKPDIPPQKPNDFMQELKSRFNDNIAPPDNRLPGESSEDEMMNPSAVNSAQGSLDLRNANLKFAPPIPDKSPYNQPVVAMDTEFEVGETREGGRFQYDRSTCRSTKKDERTVREKPGTADLSDLLKQMFRNGSGTNLTTFSYKSEENFNMVVKTTTTRGTPSE